MIEHIVILEDQFITALDIKRILNDCGFSQILIFNKGEKFLDYLKKEKPLFALLDIKLADNISGIEVGRELKKENIPFIYLSAFNDFENQRMIDELQPLKTFTKPIDENSLKRFLNDLELLSQP